MPQFREVKTKKGIHWQARVYIGRDGEGKRLWAVKTFKSDRKKDAQRWAREQMMRRDSGTLPSGKFAMSTLFDDLLLNFKINRKSPWASIVVKAHLRPYFDNMASDRVTTTVIQEYIASRQAKGRSNGTINRELTVLKRAFKLAQQETPPKVAYVPRFPHLTEDPPRKGFFEHAEYEKMLAELPAEIKPVLVFAYHTGCRRAEILSLQWSQVDLLERVVRLEPGTTKNKEARTIPLAQDVFAMITIQRELRDRFHPRCPWVFFRHDSGKPLEDFRGAWEGACKRTGLWDATKERPTRLLHDLRRTGVRNLVRAGVPERVAMAISGHKSRSVFDRYNIVSESDLKTAAHRLEGYLTEHRRKAAEEEERRTKGVLKSDEPENRLSQKPS